MDDRTMDSERYIDDRFSYLYDDRPAKPRESGITMIFGDGPFHTVFDVSQLHALITYAGAWFDWYKFNVGAHIFQPPGLVREKVRVLEQAHIEAFPGGNLIERAIECDKMDDCFDTLLDIGFHRVEVSTTAIELSTEEKAGVIERAAERGFKVHGEVGTKSHTDREILMYDALIEDMHACLDAGADNVILDYENVDTDSQGRDRANGSTAAIRPAFENAVEGIARIVDEVGANNVVFELPWTHEGEVIDACAWLINTIGPDVNIGNVTPTYLNKIEQMRRGIGVRVNVNG